MAILGKWNGPRGSGGMKLQGIERSVTLKAAVTEGQKIYVNTLDDTGDIALDGMSIIDDSLSSPVGIDNSMGISQVLYSDSTYDYRVALYEASDDDDPDVCLVRWNRYTRQADLAYGKELVNGMDDGPQIVEKISEGHAVCYYVDTNGYGDYTVVTADSNSVNALSSTRGMSIIPLSGLYMRDNVQLLLYNDDYIQVVSQDATYNYSLDFSSPKVKSSVGAYSGMHKILKANDYIAWILVTDGSTSYFQKVDTTSGDAVMGESILLGTAHAYDGRSDAIEFRDNDNNLYFFVGVSCYDTYNNYYIVYKVDEATGDVTEHKPWTKIYDSAGATTGSISTDAWWWNGYVYYRAYTPSGIKTWSYNIETGSISDIGNVNYKDGVYATVAYYGGISRRMIDKDTMIQLFEKSSVPTIRTVKKTSTGNAIAMANGNPGDTIKVMII